MVPKDIKEKINSLQLGFFNITSNLESLLLDKKKCLELLNGKMIKNKNTK
jgi:hypothetical protein